MGASGGSGGNPLAAGMGDAVVTAPRARDEYPPSRLPAAMPDPANEVNLIKVRRCMATLVRPNFGEFCTGAINLIGLKNTATAKSAEGEVSVPLRQVVAQAQMLGIQTLQFQIFVGGIHSITHGKKIILRIVPDPGFHRFKVSRTDIFSGIAVAL